MQEDLKYPNTASFSSKSYLRISISSLQYETKSWPLIDDEITIGRPVLILDQINACENKKKKDKLLRYCYPNHQEEKRGTTFKIMLAVRPLLQQQLHFEVQLPYITSIYKLFI